MERLLKGLLIVLTVCGVIGGYLYHSSTPDYEGYLSGVNEKENTIGLSINGKGIMIKVGQNTKMQDSKGNKVNIQDFIYYNWGKVWLDMKYSDIQLNSGEAVAIKVVGINDATKDITGLGPYKGPTNTKDDNPKYIYVPVGLANPTNEIKKDAKDLVIDELQVQIKSKENNIKELQDKIHSNEVDIKYLEQERDNYKRFIDSSLKYLSDSELLEMAKGEWKYSIMVDEKPVPLGGVVEVNTSNFKLSYSEKQLSYPPILPVKIHTMGRISGDFSNHIKVLDYKPNSIQRPAGTAVEAMVYEFQNVRKGVNIRLEISGELKERLDLKTNIISILIK